jgi:hypothetical protein
MPTRITINLYIITVWIECNFGKNTTKNRSQQDDTIVVDIFKFIVVIPLFIFIVYPFQS